MTFVPAWRRLGLALKGETSGETETARVTAPVTANGDLKRKRSDAEETRSTYELSNKLARARSTDEQTITPHLPPPDTHTTAAETASDKTLGLEPALNTHVGESPRLGSKRRKSVSFSADTKEAEELHRDSISQDDIAAAEDVTAETATTKADKRAKRELRRSQASQSGSTESSLQSAKPYLSYLDQYHKSRDRWKFNKAHQTQLLKHCFNIDRVPSQFDDALYEYISGLQGQSACQRLIDKAREIEASLISNDDMDNAENREKLQLDAAKRDVRIVKTALKQGAESKKQRDYDKEYPRKLEKRQRALKILEILAKTQMVTSRRNETSTDNTSRVGAASNASTEQLRSRSRGRKRKLRTGLPDDDDISSSSSSDDSSSEESSSESDSDSDEEVSSVESDSSESGSENSSSSNTIEVK